MGVWTSYLKTLVTLLPAELQQRQDATAIASITIPMWTYCAIMLQSTNVNDHLLLDGKQEMCNIQ